MKNKNSHYRWFIVGLIFLITFVNFVDRSAISFVIEPLKKEFSFTNTQFGMMLSAFGFGYLVLTGVGGWIVDRFGTRTVWSLSSIFWSLSMALIGCSTGFWGFTSFRFILGVAEGPHFPSMTRSISNWLPLSERARALAFGLLAIPVSSAVGAPIISYLVADVGWRAMFFIFGSLGLLWSILWFFFFRNRPEESSFVSPKENQLISASNVPKQAKIKVKWKKILTHPTLIANNISYFGYGYIVFFATLWLPGYFLTQHGLNLKSVGWYLTIPWIVGALFLKLGGILSDLIYKKTKSFRAARSHLIWGSQLLAAIFFILLGFSHTLGWALFLLTLGIGFGIFPQAIYFSVNIDVAKENSGAAQGISSSVVGLPGIFAPLITGWLIDLTGTYRAAFLLVSALMIIGVIVVILFHKPDGAKPIKKTDEALKNISG